MQLTALSSPQASKPISVEIDGEPVGIAVPTEAGYRFLAVRFAAFAVDGREFESVEALEEAVRRAGVQAQAGRIAARL